VFRGIVYFKVKEGLVKRAQCIQLLIVSYRVENGKLQTVPAFGCSVREQNFASSL
jgi:hypothetical protein